jgi:hypothetical protein
MHGPDAFLTTTPTAAQTSPGHRWVGTDETGMVPWNAKKIPKALAGDTYVRLRSWLLH